MKGWLLSLFILLAPNVASAFDGNTLYSWGKERANSVNSFNSGAYSGYVLGVVDSFSQNSICLPNGAQNSQILDVVYNYLNAHPENRNRHAGVLVLIAMEQAFPCKKR